MRSFVSIRPVYASRSQALHSVISSLVFSNDFQGGVAIAGSGVTHEDVDVYTLS